MLDPSSRLAVVLASAGRPALLADAVHGCLAQSDVGFRGVISVPDDASLPDDEPALAGWELVTGVRGLAAQRNAGLDLLAGQVDIVVFFDDDAVVRSDYLASALAFFHAHPAVVGLTGRVLDDGKITGEISRASALETLDRSWVEPTTGAWKRTRELYGANFAFRMSSVPQLRFDARLPLYSWLEDHDFARRLLPFGLLAHVEDCQIVHLAAASGGRVNHRRLGYSQVMNAVYLQRKGSFPTWLAAQQILRPAGKNIALSVVGTATCWRRERLRGNVDAFLDVVAGRITPERAAAIVNSTVGS